MVTVTAASSLSATSQLAAFAAEFDFGAAPEAARDAARQCLVDAVACALFGSRFRWSQTAIRATVMPTGRSTPPGTRIRTEAARAALVAGVCAHAFELDSLRKPGAGVHPGATVALPALMVAQELGRSGAQLLDAILAGVEVMFRVGAATLHTAEKRGFHAPGITGVIGSAVATARLMNLPAPTLVHALGLAGSMGGGLLRFAKSGDGGMVKRLHLGRAAQAGIEAARLAASGFEGPSDILEGRFGVLETYCETFDTSLLTAGLGDSWEIGKMCLKRYACHVTAQAPVEALAGLERDHEFGPDDIAEITLRAPAKIASHHAEKHPGDLALAQYSVPFMLAFSAYYDLDDPAVLTDHNIADSRVHALADRITVQEDAGLTAWTVHLTLNLADGREISAIASDYEGSPERPFGRAAFVDRFLRLTSGRTVGAPREMLDALLGIDGAADLSRLSFAGPSTLEDGS